MPHPTSSYGFLLLTNKHRVGGHQLVDSTGNISESWDDAVLDDAGFCTWIPWLMSTEFRRRVTGGAF